MEDFMRNLVFASAAMMVALCATPSLAQTRSQVWGGPLTQQAQTIYVRADVGMTTYESEAADSKETRESMTYSVGGWAGEGRVVGISMTSSKADVPFSLNDSSLKTSFQDVRMMARLAWFTPSIGVSLSEVDVREGEVDTVGVYGTGMSAGLAVGIPLHTRLVMQAEAMVVESSKVYDKLDQDTKLGRRSEADAHLSFDVTDRIVDLLVGYRLRSFELEVEEEKLQEKSQGAYAGLRLGLYF